MLIDCIVDCASVLFLFLFEKLWWADSKLSCPVSKIKDLVATSAHLPNDHVLGFIEPLVASQVL